ncbi:hypothetical protein C2R22_15465 [Salinigranum rubrum]|uniref:DUF58 domain-containing protein n=1 Tax=Salinigranum rubrum TaxID=755307 RepID=A0A2I8VLU7_9EURY|nr:DUF58 domain-containing protein [Salinigranum rubrum]AUV82865.1 hypothetical protein C2R22_15465 [Salinigranum rubrum]
MSLPEPVDADLAVEIETPMASRQTTTGPTATMDAGVREATGETTLVWDVAGHYRLDAPTVTLRDRAGLFVARLAVGDAFDVSVDPPHVGRVALGRTGRELVEDAERKSKLNIRSGIEPEGVRPHVLGDSIRYVDWKATARRNELHVREFNMERGRSAGLVIDTRQSMSEGPVGRTKLDHVRHLALSLQESARAQHLPVGVFVCDETGVVHRIPARLRSDAVRKRIRELQADPVDRGHRGTSGRHGVGRVRTRRSPVAASRTARALDGDGSPFATRLRPFFARNERPSRLGLVSDDPLYEAVMSFRGQQSGPAITYLFTDDTHRETLPESLRAATRGDGEAVVFLTPSVLFDPDTLSNPKVAYDRFVEFERFRRSIAALPRVSVYEVGPGEELAMVLSKSGGRRRQRTNGHTRQTAGGSGGFAATPTTAAAVEDGE